MELYATPFHVGTRNVSIVRICKLCGTFTRLKRQVSVEADRRRDSAGSKIARAVPGATPRRSMSTFNHGGRKEEAELVRRCRPALHRNYCFALFYDDTAPPLSPHRLHSVKLSLSLSSVH